MEKIESKKTVKRMDKPSDKLVKRQAAYAGDVIHEFNKLPGKFISSCPNEYPNSEITNPRVDSAYFVDIGGRKYIIDREDESGPLDESVWEKIRGYRGLLQYAFDVPVITVITTDRLVDKSLIPVGISPTTTTDVIVISYPTWDGGEMLSTIRDKIGNKKIRTDVEAMGLVMIPKMFLSGNDKILEEVCVLLKDAKVHDDFFKYELVMEMRCMIHKYAKTLDDIKRLEGVIGLQNACIAMKQHEQALIERVRKETLEQGINQGAFDVALRVKRVLGLDVALSVCDFSREELESEKLNR